MAPVRVLHLHSSFALGGKEARAVRLMNAFGDSARHTVVSASPDELSARDALGRAVVADFPQDAPPLNGLPTPARLLRLARYMRGFDLVLTYNWGAFDAVMARRLFGGPPLVHHEDGFNADEAAGLLPRRSRYRRVGLPAAFRLVVPSERLERIARDAWRQPAARVARIPNGIAVARYAAPPSSDAIPGFAKAPGEILVGTVAGLRAVKNLPRLVRAFAGIGTDQARLVIVGSGPESERIAAEARRLGVAGRVLMPGFLADPARWIGLFDIFALSSDSEQFPISLVEAMAAGLPAVATDVGDIPHMVSDDNAPLIVHPGDEAAFAAALASLAARPDLRRAIGRANREKAARCYEEGGMIAAYAGIYGEAIGRPGAFKRGAS
ncbi:MAG: glycosyltransferase [Alphaproteobacteria bacterium]|nr:glycosyltransferase [Alphaproteobacteria bacterium]MBV9373411.1 glycosyltransferase [Alphaproteobacteria bacterium]MBV9902539.1 glycosyltransferase [Alphaproteobacteria bacterium]